ncbi:DUF4390 domain-containing protein [Aquimonas voraii]|uniref:DUF4390 domain-containing protein n=1 Tax=Aquimonas voraii TaxID=265719 RepID=A0A1G6WPM9_9GAMM|nr:DUF4390 domain-containing protein [Aquimonas voraii]SDD67761.1 protein of unknown function [Aquimonas voraii]
MASSSLHCASAERLRWSAAGLLMLLAGCGAVDAPRARIEDARRLQRGDSLQLEVQQQLEFQPLMLEALANGIGLRLDYHLQYCESAERAIRSLWLRYYPLAGEYEMRWEGEAQGRRFARRGSLLAALDRIRIELPARADKCELQLRVELERSALPAPLRFPALIGLQDWRLVSGTYRLPAVAAP